VKVGGSQDTWHKTIGYSPTATKAQETLNRDQGLNITRTIAKHTRKQLELFEALAIEIGYH